MDQTPEEKLLSLIRKKDSLKGDVSKAPGEKELSFQEAQSSDEKSEKPALKKTEVISDFEKSFWAHHITKKFFYRELKNFNLERDDLILFVVLMLSVVFLNWYMGANVRSHAAEQDDIKRDSMKNALLVKENSASYSRKYKKDFSKKNIFITAPKKRVIKKSTRKETGPTIYDLIKDLKVIGVIMDGPKPRVIIQSRKIHSSKQVGEGGMINEMKVEKIEYGGIQDKIVLSYDGETAEIAF